MKYTHIVVHYDEIGLKGKNRPKFEVALAKNIKQAVGEYINAVKRERGQILITLKKEYDAGYITKRLSITPGIAHFSFALKTKLDMIGIKKTALKLLTKGTFKVNTKRHNKNFTKKSPDVNTEVGLFLEKKTGLTVKMKNPNTEIVIEICNKNAFLSAQKIPGVGGLPVGTAGKAITLISGGIDSPVASFLMMKRGSKAVFVHFQNKTQMTIAVQDKIEQVIEQLSLVQGKSKLYIVPFGDIQKAIIRQVPSKQRMLVYRRLMLRIAEKICDKEKAKALVLGDSLSQVASQTMENLGAVYSVASKLILCPLIGMNKLETTNLAKRIGTYEPSILPYPDCCSFLIAKHPETKATTKQLDKCEKDLDVDKLVSSAVRGAIAKVINV